MSPRQVLTEKRRLGSKDGPPHLVVVVTLHAGVDAAAVAKLLCSEGAGGLVRQERCVSGVAESFGLILPRFKQRFTLVRPDTGGFTTSSVVTRPLTPPRPVGVGCSRERVMTSR